MKVKSMIKHLKAGGVVHEYDLIINGGAPTKGAIHICWRLRNGLQGSEPRLAKNVWEYVPADVKKLCSYIRRNRGESILFANRSTPLC